LPTLPLLRTQINGDRKLHLQPVGRCGVRDRAVRLSLFPPEGGKLKQSNRLKTHVDLNELMVLFATLAFLVEIGWSLRSVLGLLIVLLALVGLASREQS
jgi:hypothetical protein